MTKKNWMQKRKEQRKTKKSDKGIKLLSPNQRIPHECSYSGRCCFTPSVGLLPFDSWRMVNSPTNHLKQYGIKNTKELFDGRYAVCTLGSESGLPIAYIVPQKWSFSKTDKNILVCPFLKTDFEIEPEHAEVLKNGWLPDFWLVDGKPRFYCGLGSAKPIQCELFPFRRIGEPGDAINPGKWRFYCDDCCESCMPSLINPEGIEKTVLEYIDDPWIKLCLQYTKDYLDTNMFILINQFPKKAREFLCGMMFDTDGILLQGGVDPDKLDEYRAKTPDEIYMSINLVMSSILGERKKAEESLQAENKPKIITP